MNPRNTLGKTLIAGMGVLGSFYADPNFSASVPAPEKSFPAEETQLLMAKLASLTDEKAQQQDQLFLAGIQQRITGKFTEQFAGKTAEQIESLASELGFDVEWQAV